jgi:FMN phosphatase YigB (HAD superfamily)
MKDDDESAKQAYDHGAGSSEVRVVSFDLDNTVWKTGPTIQAANDVLASFLEKQGIEQPERVETVMGRLFRQSKSTYAPLGGDDPKAPILLTQLRKDAVRFVLENSNGFSESRAKKFSDLAFEVWTNARHEVLPQHLASNVLECLQQIRQIRTSMGQPILIGAITDGNSDPRRVPVIGEFFDFVVNSESVRVGKPDRRVYMKAIKEASSHPFLSDIFDNVDMEDVDVLEGIVGPWWVHVGDDFLKDIVAAKDLGMRSIWAKELIPELREPDQPQLPTKSVEEFVKEMSDKLADNSVIEMTVGADDYLARSLRDEFADSTVFTFADIGATVITWHQQADVNLKHDADDLSVKNASSSSNPNSSASPPPVGNTKFCMSCGGKLPATAKFCSSCGEKQS